MNLNNDGWLKYFPMIENVEIKIKMLKLQTDITINDYNGLVFNSTLLPPYAICKSLINL